MLHLNATNCQAASGRPYNKKNGTTKQDSWFADLQSDHHPGRDDKVNWFQHSVTQLTLKQGEELNDPGVPWSLEDSD